MRIIYTLCLLLTSCLAMEEYEPQPTPFPAIEFYRSYKDPDYFMVIKRREILTSEGETCSYYQPYWGTPLKLRPLHLDYVNYEEAKDGWARLVYWDCTTHGRITVTITRHTDDNQSSCLELSAGGQSIDLLSHVVPYRDPEALPRFRFCQIPKRINIPLGRVMLAGGISLYFYQNRAFEPWNKDPQRQRVTVFTSDGLVLADMDCKPQVVRRPLSNHVFAEEILCDVPLPNHRTLSLVHYLVRQETMDPILTWQFFDDLYYTKFGRLKKHPLNLKGIAEKTGELATADVHQEIYAYFACLPLAALK